MDKFHVHTSHTITVPTDEKVEIREKNVQQVKIRRFPPLFCTPYIFNQKTHEF